jgi:RNA polymerase sigma factor (sigma-70 family)
MLTSDLSDQFFGLNGNPDPVAAAVAKLDVPPGVDRADVVQECRLAVLRQAKEKIEAGQAIRKPFSFAYTIARGRALTYLRGESRRASRQRPLPCQVEARKPKRNRGPKPVSVRRALNRLSRDLRRPVKLCWLDGMTQAAACRQLGISPYELRERLAEARFALKRVLRGANVPVRAAAPPRRR